MKTDHITVAYESRNIKHKGYLVIIAAVSYRKTKVFIMI